MSDLVGSKDFVGCRTCGVYYPTNSGEVVSLFSEQISECRKQLGLWNIIIKEDDNLPTHICNSCSSRFSKIFMVQQRNLDAMRLFQQLNRLRSANILNPVQVKSEPDELDESGFVMSENNEPQEESETEELKNIENSEKMVQIKQIGCNNYDENPHKNYMPPLPVNMANNAVIDNVTIWSSEYDETFRNKEKLSDNMPCAVETSAKHIQFEQDWDLQYAYTPKVCRRYKCAICGISCPTKGSRRWHLSAKHMFVPCPICKKFFVKWKLSEHKRKHQRRKPTQIKIDYMNDENSNIDYQTDDDGLDNTQLSKREPSLNDIWEFENDIDMNVNKENSTDESAIEDGNSCGDEESSEDKEFSEVEESSDDMESSEIEESYSDEHLCSNNHATNIYKRIADPTVDSDENTSPLNNNILATTSEDSNDNTTYFGEYACDHCSNKYKSLIELKLHENEHRITVTFPCTICSKVFKLEFHLRRHLAKHKESI